MSKKIMILYSLLLVALLALSAFIYRSNDHVECETITKTTVNEKGDKTVTTSHICKERFNF